MTIRQLAFRACWPAVLDVIRRPDVQAVLDAGLADYEAQYPGRAKYTTRSMPWSYTTSDYWACWAEDRLAASSELEGWDTFYARMRKTGTEDEEDLIGAVYADYVDDMLCQQYPEEDTPEHFMFYGGCHWLADWQARIGQILMPELEWKAVRGRYHSTAVGYAPYTEYGIPVVVLDILREDEDPRDTLADAVRTRPRRKAARKLAEGEKPWWPRLALMPDDDLVAA